MESPSFPMEKSEYSSVFKVFDKEGKGEIEIGQVMELINNLEESAKESTKDQNKQSSQKEGQNTIGMVKQASEKSKGVQPAKSPGRRKQLGGLGSNVKTSSQPSNIVEDDPNMNYGNIHMMEAGASKPKPKQEEPEPTFPGGHKSINVEQLMSIIKDSCEDREKADNYLVYAFSMFDRQKKGYINSEDLKSIFEILGESVTEEEIKSKVVFDDLAMIQIAGTKSNDKINFKEFVEFFYKVD